MAKTKRAGSKRRNIKAAYEAVKERMSPAQAKEEWPEYPPVANELEARKNMELTSAANGASGDVNQKGAAADTEVPAKAEQPAKKGKPKKPMPSFMKKKIAKAPKRQRASKTTKKAEPWY